MIIIQSDAKFGERILGLRQMVKRSREYFYEKFHFSPATIRKWETLYTGSSNINVKKLREYLNIYETYFGIKISMDWLLYGVGEGPALIKNMLLTTESVLGFLFDEKPLFFFVDLDMYVQNINPKYKSLISNEPIENLERKHLSEILSNDTYCEFLPVVENVLNTKKNLFYKFISRNDENKKLVLSCRPVLNNENQIIGVFNFLEGEIENEIGIQTKSQF